MLILIILCYCVIVILCYCVIVILHLRTVFNCVLFILGVYQSVRYKTGDDNDLYVDGGLLCNYPIHAFDGKAL